MYKLKYNKIPTEWINGLPLGNGRLAAMYWGEDKKDIFSLNHESLWSAKYKGKEPDYAADKLPLLRELLKKRDYFRATVFANVFFACLGGDSAAGPGRIDSFQPAGDLMFDFCENCVCLKSELDIVSAVTNAERGNSVKTSAFVDANDGCVMIKWQSSSPFSGKLSFERPYDENVSGECVYDENGISYTCKVYGTSYRTETIISTNGNKSVDKDGILIENATELVCCANIILSDSDTRELSCDFDLLFEKHACKFKSEMDKLVFEIDTPDSEECTDKRIKNIKSGKADDKLQELYYHYGRYLMISSCICGCLPPNLQGKWNRSIRPPWNADYHLDINMAMNEWMIEQVGMGDYAHPVADFLLSLIDGGRKAAQRLYGCRGIWLPYAVDIWGEPTPESFGYTVWPSAAAWIAQPLWKHWEYTGDKEFLKKSYAFFKEVALFYEDYLEEDENGVMQLMPSQSPENRFKGAGIPCTVGICTSSGVDVQLCYDGLGYAINTSKILGVDAKDAEKWEALREKLPPFAIGSDGRLLEWNEEFEEEQPGHKHLSHLYGLYPGDIFTPDERKAEYDAAEKSFRFRMAHESGYTGWSRAWISNIFARLGDKENFYAQITGLLHDFATESLLDIHPDPLRPGVGPDIFQIDGNFGMVSAVDEALCSFVDGKARLLHALPKSWKNGRLKGLKTPGGHTISMEWKDGKLSELEVTLGFDRSLTLVADGEEIVVEGNKGETKRII